MNPSPSDSTASPLVRSEEVRTIAVHPIWQAIYRKLADPQVSEFRLNGAREIFFKAQGVAQPLGVGFDNDDDYMKSLAGSLVPQVKSDRPFRADGFLFEGSLEYSLGGVPVKARCHIVLPPACRTPHITIAKHSTSLLSLDDLTSSGSLSVEMAEFIKASVKARLGIVFSGQTGAGKTTMMEAVAKLIPGRYRIGVAEDVPELMLTQPDVAYLHSVPWAPGVDPNMTATLSWCVAQFKRMRVDSLIIGETRGAEFYDYLVAANSGIEGCLTTLHANTPVRALDAMKGFAAKGAPEVSPLSLARDVASAVDLIVQLIITTDGRYRVGVIEEITDTVDKNGGITTSTLYRWDSGRDGFERVNLISDNLRRKFASHRVDYNPFVGSGSFDEDFNLFERRI